jgi:hypothetical protein
MADSPEAQQAMLAALVAAYRANSYSNVSYCPSSSSLRDELTLFLVYCKISPQTNGPDRNLPMTVYQAMAGFSVVVADFLQTFPDEVNTFRKCDIASPD